MTIRSDHKSISFLKKCKLRLTRWILALQEYDLNWEYIPGRKNTIADGLLRINTEEGSFEGEKEEILKVYHILQSRSDLERILQDIGQQQLLDDHIKRIIDRIQQNDTKITKFFQIHQSILFFSHGINHRKWKIVIPRHLEGDLISDYHTRYGHMGTKKVVKALEEHVYIKGLYKKVKNNIRICHIC